MGRMRTCTAMVASAKSNPTTAYAIAGGNEAAPSAWPWMTAMVDAGSPNALDSQFCGGALIRPHWVVTAAHCLEGASAGKVDVVLGRHNLNAGGGEQINITQIYVHADYATNGVPDIALLQLASPSSQTPLAVAISCRDVISST